MTVIEGRPLVRGLAQGHATVTRMPLNLTAAFTKPANLLPSRRSQVEDRHHDLVGRNIKGSVLVCPTLIGSTYGGMVLLELLCQDCAPAAIVVQRADSLMLSGAILGDVWFQKTVPAVEYRFDDLFEKIRDKDTVQVDGGTGRISIK